MEDEEKVNTSTPTENDGTKEPVNTTENEKKQVEVGLNEPTDNDLEETDKSKEEGQEEPKQDKDKKVEKTFTQADVDKVVEKRIARLTAQHKKELEDLEQRYKSGDYSPEIKSLKDELLAEKAKNSQVQSQLARYEIDTAFMKEGVADEFKDFVEYKVLRMVTEENDFAKCLKDFKAEGENSRYFKTTGGKPVVPPRPTNSNANTEQIAGERALEKSMGL